MTPQNMTYTIEKINAILFDGFDYKLPDETLEIISSLSLQVGSPDYVKTPNFKKRENPMKVEPSYKIQNVYKKGRHGKATEIVNDEDWDSIRTVFNTTKLEVKTGIDSHIDSIRVYLNKLTDKNYIDIRNKIIDIIENLKQENITEEDMSKLSTVIFDIASTNRFYSKIYADLYSDLSTNYEIMNKIYEKNFENFIDLFNSIDYIDPSVNYDKFCENNKINEKRKSIANFYLNLMHNGIIPKFKIILITRNILSLIFTFILQDDKKNEVDELTETLSILYKKDLYENDNGEEYQKIEGFTINEIVHQIANSKVKDYKSLTNKTLFKFMDLIDM
jgi:hypothetical protein